jgi:hypothetical protein
MVIPYISAIISPVDTVGLMGGQSFDIWLTLSVDHLLPVGHPDRAICHDCS